MRWLVRGIWLMVLAIIAATAGRWLSMPQSARQANDVLPDFGQAVEKSMPAPVDWSRVDREIARALQQAREQALAYADAQLQQWMDEMMARVDKDFLPWYFDYWTQQALGLEGLWRYGRHALDASQPTAQAALQAKIEREFSNRVLRPQLAELRLQRIVRETVRRYVTALRSALAQLPKRYRIPPRAWAAHLVRIAITVEGFEGGRQTPLTLKALTAAGAGGTALLTAKLTAMLGKGLAKGVGAASGKMATKLAAKAGGEAAAKAGGKLIGAALGVGILVWDLWDHRKTVAENRPLLRQAIAEHLAALKDQLLNDPQTGLSRVFLDLERQAVDLAQAAEQGGADAR